MKIELKAVVISCSYHWRQGLDSGIVHYRLNTVVEIGSGYSRISGEIPLQVPHGLDMDRALSMALKTGRVVTITVEL